MEQESAVGLGYPPFGFSTIKFGRQYYEFVQKTIKKIFKYKRFVQQEKKIDPPALNGQ